MTDSIFILIQITSDNLNIKCVRKRFVTLI